MPHPSLLLSWRDLLRLLSPGACPALSVSHERVFFRPTLRLKHTAQPLVPSYIHETALEVAGVRTEAALITSISSGVRVAAFPAHTDRWRNQSRKQTVSVSPKAHSDPNPRLLHLMCHVGTCGCSFVCADQSKPVPLHRLGTGRHFSAEGMLFKLSHFGFYFLNDSSVLCLVLPS